MSREIMQQIVIALKALMTGYVGDAEDAIYAIEKELAKPEPQVCCGDYEKCWKACTPRGRWLAEKELAKPEQEPVAWMYKGNFHDFDPSEWASPEFVVTPLYTAPPRKEWVGLSVNEGRDFFESKLTRAELITEISEFLEEKNT